MSSEKDEAFKELLMHSLAMLGALRMRDLGAIEDDEYEAVLRSFIDAIDKAQKVLKPWYA